MYRYKTLKTAEENAYISPFTEGHVLLAAEHNPCLQANPLNPNPLVIPSHFDYASWDKNLDCVKRSEPVKSQPPERLIDRGTVYGPSTSGHASLRYYGVGPY